MSIIKKHGGVGPVSTPVSAKLAEPAPGTPAASAVAPDRLTVSRSASKPAADQPSWGSRLLDAAGWLAGGATTLIAGVPALVAGPLGIYWAHRRLREAKPQPPIPAEIPRGYNMHVVDDKLWRGSAPRGLAAYRALKAAGVDTIVDLRFSRDTSVDVKAVEAMGLNYVNLPIRDGQIPGRTQVEAFLAAVEASGGKTYVHCQAGVGRTGSMVGSYLVKTGQATASEALERVLAVGPPSLEQISFVRAQEPEGYNAPSPFLVGMSRVLDAPRRIWANAKHHPVMKGVLDFVSGR